MLKALGLLELNSIARGVESADYMMKAATIQLIQARAVCPGKFLIIVTGEVGAVTVSMNKGRSVGGHFVVDDLLIPNLHEQVVEAIGCSGGIRRQKALGVIEYFSMASAVLGADSAVKTADIQLIEVRLGIGIGGKSFTTMTGDINAVKEAVRAGKRDAEENGMLIAVSVIPSLSDELWPFLL
jgi:microcompartment protein CcmL/EutN